MFLDTAILNKLMKQAYKSGLRVARTEQGTIYLAGMYWEVEIKEEFMNKKTKGDLIALVGDLPESGQSYIATKDGNQLELELEPRTINEEMMKVGTLTITDVLLLGTFGTMQRLLQDEQTGNIYVINNVFVNMINNEIIEESKGEYAVGDPFFHPAAGVLWKNNVCKLRVRFRSDEKNEKVLEALKGVDITPEVV